MDREALIARKHAVRRQLERAHGALAEIENAADPKERDRRRIAQLQSEIEHLAAEEFNLRLAIDRASRSGAP